MKYSAPNTPPLKEKRCTKRSLKQTTKWPSMMNPIQKQLIAVKKSARPSKAELTATKSNDIIMRPCARCASCKINIS